MNQLTTPTDPKSHTPVSANPTPRMPRVEAVLRYAPCGFHTHLSFAIISMVDPFSALIASVRLPEASLKTVASKLLLAS